MAGGSGISIMVPPNRRLAQAKVNRGRATRRRSSSLSLTTYSRRQRLETGNQRGTRVEEPFRVQTDRVQAARRRHRVAAYLAADPHRGASVLGGKPRRLEGSRGRRRQPEPGVHRSRRHRRAGRQAGPALCAAGRRQLAAAAGAIAISNRWRCFRSRRGRRRRLVPRLFATDRVGAAVVMEYLQPHIILRKALIPGRGMSA